MDFFFNNNWTTIGFYFLSVVVCILSTIILVLWNLGNISFNKKELFEVINTSLLSEENVIRYSRQIALKEIGVFGQAKLKNSKVLVIGAGGLGSPILFYLSGAGIGVIGVVDHDIVSTSNLHRQIIHSTHKSDMNKAISAKESCSALNPNTRIITYQEVLSAELIKEIFPLYDIIVDATDNCRSRYLISDAAVYYKKPLVSGAVLKWQGHVTIYNYQNGPCYRCIAPREDNGKVDGTPGGAETFGVLGMVVGVIGCLQATEVVKIILNDLENGGDENSQLPTLSGKMLFYNSLSNEQMLRIVNLRNRDQNCKSCGKNSTPFFKINVENYKIYKGMEMVQNSFYPIPSSKIINCNNIEKFVSSMRNSNIKINIFDIRPKSLFEISHIKSSINMSEDIFLRKLADFGIQVDSKTGQIIAWVDENNAIVKDYLIKTFIIGDNSIIIVLCWNGVRSFFISTLIEQCFKRLDMQVSNYYLFGGISSIRDKFLSSFPNL